MTATSCVRCSFSRSNNAPAISLASGVCPPHLGHAPGSGTDAIAHGLGHRLLDSRRAVAFETRYSSGEAVAYGEVLIKAPGGGEVEYQNGRTDAKGRFAFIPDRDGSWDVVVNAGMGHRHAFAVDVANEKAVTQEVKPSRVLPGLLGVSLLANIALAVAAFRRRTA